MPNKNSRQNVSSGRINIDLSWADKHLKGFKKMRSGVLETKASEKKYKELLEKKEAPNAV